MKDHGDNVPQHCSLILVSSSQRSSSHLKIFLQKRAGAAVKGGVDDGLYRGILHAVEADTGVDYDVGKTYSARRAAHRLCFDGQDNRLSRILKPQLLAQ